MKAIRIHEHGGADALKWDDIPNMNFDIINQIKEKTQ
mgnify:CR=1 FL=1